MRSEFFHALSVKDRKAITNDPLADPGGEQHRLWGPAIPTVSRVFPHLWADAHPQPDARIVLHVGGLFWGNTAGGRGQFLGSGARKRPRHGNHLGPRGPASAAR